MKRTALIFTLGCLFANSFATPFPEDLFRTNDEEEGKLWVLLAAGSNGYNNYRHQADVCHAYQVVKEHGVPEENIIVMMYDDIAYNDENPDKGVIINKINGPNVYEGVPKDYTGENNNPEVFLKVLSGIDPGVGSRRVINSTSKDRIFVFFSDHGAPGLICFEDRYVTSVQLNKVIKKMHDEEKYDKMVFYIEACESGSIFQHFLPSNISVFATTASNAKKPSYACYYDDHLQAYLGDLYSVTWMEQSDRVDLKEMDLKEQYDYVKRNVKLSPVCKFGDMDMGNLSLSLFQGDGEKEEEEEPRLFDTEGHDLTPIISRDVSLDILLRKGNRAEVSLFKAKRNYLSSVVKDILSGIESLNHRSYFKVMNQVSELTPEISDCYYEIVEEFHEKCFNIVKNEYALGLLKHFVNVCEFKIPAEEVVASINRVCNNKRDNLHGRIL